MAMIAVDLNLGIFHNSFMGDEMAFVSYKLLRILAQGLCFLIHLKFQHDLVLECIILLSSFYWLRCTYQKKKEEGSGVPCDKINDLKGGQRDLAQNTCWKEHYVNHM